MRRETEILELQPDYEATFSLVMVLYAILMLHFSKLLVLWRCETKFMDFKPWRLNDRNIQHLVTYIRAMLNILLIHHKQALSNKNK